MKMSAAAQRLLHKIGDTDEACTKLTKSNAKAADELKNLYLAVFIPISTGGGDVALTAAGIDAYEKLVGV